MVSGELLVTSADGVVRLTLNRPEQRNALTPELIERLLGELDEIEADPELRALVLTGTGDAFCAGYDVNRLVSPGGPDAGFERDLVERLCSRVRVLPSPTVAKVNGVASGGGCDLAVSCDVRFAAETARFAMPPARLGILYSRQGIARLTALVGPALAKELLFSGELVDAGRALEIGLVNRVVPPERLDEETERFVDAVAGNAPLAVSAAKEIVNLIADGAPLPAAAQDAIDQVTRRVWTSADAVEGPRAFRERRTPRFTGR
jgi:enoyl-CoA hydratase/carnithine racemase